MSRPRYTILVIDDDQQFLGTVAELLMSDGHEPGAHLVRMMRTRSVCFGWIASRSYAYIPGVAIGVTHSIAGVGPKVGIATVGADTPPERSEYWSIPGDF